MLALLLVGGLGACATGGGAPSLLGWQPDGGYVLTKAERGWRCESLENTIGTRINTIVALKYAAKAESAAAPPTVSGFFQRLTQGAGADSPSLAKIKPERAAADAYNTRLRADGCPPVDIDARIAAAFR